MNNLLITFALTLCFLLQGCASHYPINKPWYPVHQLPDTVAPIKYELSINLNPDNNTVLGSVQIHINTLQNINHIYLHANNIDILKANLINENSILPIKAVSIKNTSLIRLDLNHRLNPGSYKLDLVFRSYISKNFDGFYKINYQDQDFFISSDKPFSIRKIFPCFDEPRFKTPYKIKARLPIHNTMLTNSSIDNVNTVDGLTVIDFEQTSPISTAELVFLVGSLESYNEITIKKNSIRKYDVQVRNQYLSNRSSYENNNLKLLTDLVKSLENYIKIAYPYDRINLLNSPFFSSGDVNSGSLINSNNMYKDVGFVRKNLEKSSLYYSQSYQLMLNWFDSIITSKTWNDLWASRAISLWIAKRIPEESSLGYSVESLKLMDKIDTLSLDAMGSIPLRNYVSNDDIRLSLNPYTQKKSSVIFDMISDWIGEKKFKEGIHEYITSSVNMLGSFLDFENILKSHLPVDKKGSVGSMFSDFIYQAGIPLIEIDTHCNNKKIYLKILQSNYTSLGSKASDDKLWRMPVCLMIKDNMQAYNHCVWVDKKINVYRLPSTECPSAVLPNSNQAGYYVWSLSSEYNKKNIENIHNFTLLEASDFMNNEILQFRRGERTIGDLIFMIKLAADRNDMSVTVFSKLITQLYDNLSTQDQWSSITEQLLPVWRRILTSDAPINILYLSQISVRDWKLYKEDILFKMLFEFRDSSLRALLKDYSRKIVHYPGDPKFEFKDMKLPGLLANNLLRLGVEEFGLDYVRHLLKLLIETNDAGLRKSILNAIIYVEDKKTFKEVVYATMHLSNILKFEQAEVFSLLFQNPSARSFSWDLFKIMFEQWKEIFGSNVELLTKPIGYFCDARMRSEVSELYSLNTNKTSLLIEYAKIELHKLDHCLALKKYLSRNKDTKLSLENF